MNPSSKPFYLRPWFRVGIFITLAVAVTAAVLLATHKFPVKPAGKVDTGKIEVKTDPIGATLTLDNKPLKEKSNTTIKARPGEHTVKLHLDGFDDQEVKLTLQAIEEPYELQHTFTRQGLTVLPSTKPGESATKTYTNDKFGYTFNYPAQWSVDTDPNGVAHVYNAVSTEVKKKDPGAEIEEALAVLEQANPQNLDAAAWYKARPEFSQEDQSQIKTTTVQASGQTAFQFDSPYGFVPYLTTVFTGKGHAFLLQQKSNSPDRKIYDNIIQNFRLL